MTGLIVRPAYVVYPVACRICLGLGWVKGGLWCRTCRGKGYRWLVGPIDMNDTRPAAKTGQFNKTRLT
jgi:hypothetical protein